MRTVELEPETEEEWISEAEEDEASVKMEEVLQVQDHRTAGRTTMRSRLSMAVARGDRYLMGFGPALDRLLWIGTTNPADVPPRVSYAAARREPKEKETGEREEKGKTEQETAAK